MTGTPLAPLPSVDGEWVPTWPMMLVFSTFPTEDKAREVIGLLVEERAIACGNILAPVRSIYRWQGEVRDEVEVLALLKVSRNACAHLQKRLRELHPYETPEIVAVSVDSGLPEYLDWVRENCRRLR